MPHRLEAALRRLKEQEALTAEAERIAGIGTYIYDPVAREAIWSRQVRRIYGLPDDDEPVSVDDGLACIHPDDLPAFLTTIRNSVSSGEVCELEHRVLHKDGEIRWVHARGQMVRIEGHANMVMVGTVQDITERRAREALIDEQSARLRAMEAELLFQSRQSAMGIMASTMAHELNQPLATITFLAAALQLASPGRLGDDEVREMIGSVKDNAMRAGRIIQRLRQSAAADGLRQEKFVAAQLVREAIRFSTIGCEGVDFELRLGDHALRGDGVQIQQVLVNLIRNACQAVAGQPDARVSISSAPSPDDSTMLRISVADNGPGIPEAMLPHIFGSGVTTKADGMGLGLSICRTIVEGHGGTIAAANLHPGARFTVDIPLEGAAHAGPPSQPPADRPAPPTGAAAQTV